MSHTPVWAAEIGTDRSATAATHAPAPAGAESVLRVGVLAQDGPEQARAQWTATVDYLSAAVDGCGFELLPIGPHELMPMLEADALDVVICEPGLYAQAEVLHGIRRIATMQRLRLDSAHAVQGAAVFCRADRDDLHKLADLDGKSFMWASTGSFGAWHMAVSELRRHRIHPEYDFVRLTFGGEDEVIAAVRDGHVDAGTVRAGVLEQMAADGRADLSDFRILNAQPMSPVFPLRRSTGLYPEWPTAVCRRVSGETAKRVAAALLSMPASSPAAVNAGCAGWTVPLDYAPVGHCLRELHFAPRPIPTVSNARQSLAANLHFLVGQIILLVIAFGIAGHASRLNIILRERQCFLHALLDGVDVGVAVVDAETHEVVEVNRAAGAGRQAGGGDRGVSAMKSCALRRRAIARSLTRGAM